MQNFGMHRLSIMRIVLWRGCSVLTKASISRLYGHQLIIDKDVIMRFDTKGGLTECDKLTFIDATIIQQDAGIVGSTWVYDEIYRKEEGYEVHTLMAREQKVELVLECKDIIIE